MKRIKFNKEKISIENIGVKRFWIGIISGLFSAYAIALLVNRTREFIRWYTSLYQDLLLFDKNELLFFNYFIVSLSTVLGFSITIWIWMSNSIHKSKKHKIYKQQALSNALFFFWLILFLLAKLSSLFIYLGVTGVNSYDTPLYLHKEHKLLFILIPIVLFSQNWSFVRRSYKTGKWVLTSLAIIVMTALIITKITTVDQNLLNNIYFKKHKAYYTYLDSTIIHSEKKYSIKFDIVALNTLRLQKSFNSIKQLREIKKAFAKNQKIALDTIIIQKIMIHNLKAKSNYRSNNNSRTFRNWEYALPKDILKQIQYFTVDSNETKELFEVLKEEILLINKAKIIVENQNNSSIYYSFSAKYEKELLVNIAVVEQLLEVTNELKSKKNYSELSKILPDIKDTSSLDL